MLNKSFGKRLKATRRGKLLARRPGKNHFNAKASREKMLQKNRPKKVTFGTKVRQRFIGKVK